ncbi:shikimate kinase [Azospirillum rugosum]|uniref:Shikimate kinase n=1 Tax=Azospirillum rugosum TaxID=416170 RepID=A0ABS4SI68_9PROT|nr:shikimate kinase [Azospirillum rugosum]MBP2292263.1 shikimate kinase [Azospirillum rugosum]MDQ0526022.1 shikimate kinase [Azospirillum rugosum]
MTARAPSHTPPQSPPSGPAKTLPKTVVLVGLMGAGKSAIGRRLAARLHLPFVDADTEIEAAAGCTIAEIFARDGEAVFRSVERKIIARLLTEQPVHILATGGGAFMDPETRAMIRRHGLSVWLRAELDVLLARTARRTHRPLLNSGDPKEILQRLMTARYPVYAEADLTVISDERPPEATVEQVLDALEAHFGIALRHSGHQGGHHRHHAAHSSDKT